MGSIWKRIPENLTAEEFMLAFAQQFNQWAADKDRFESSVTTPTSKRSSGRTVTLTREPTVDITRVGQLTGVTGSVADIPFITTSNTSSLNAERALAVADPLNKDDNGAGSTIVLGVSYATPSFTFSTANAAGSNARPVRSDATLAIFDGTSPEGISTGLSAGSAAFAARRDHVHNITATDVARVSKLTGVSNSTTLTLFDPTGVSQSLESSVRHLLQTTAGTTGWIDFGKPIRVKRGPFGSASDEATIVVDNNGAMLGGRDDPANAPFTTFFPLDDGATDRSIFFGGGAVSNAPDATNIQFWTAPTYTESVNTAVLRAEISPTSTQHADHANAMVFQSAVNIIPVSDAAMSLGSKGPPAVRNRRFAFVCGMTALIDGTFSHSGNSYGVFSVTPVARQSQTTDIKDALTNYGWLQGTTMSPLNLDGGTFTAGDIISNGSAGMGSLFLKDNLSANYLRIRPTNGNAFTADRYLEVDVDNDTRRLVVTNNSMGSITLGDIPIWSNGGVGSNMMRILGSAVSIDPTTGALTYEVPNGSSASYILPQGTAPSAPLDGDFWHDSTQNTEIAFLSGIKNHRHGGLYSATADATADATTEETLIGSGVGTVTLPANFFVAGKSVYFENQGYANHSISNQVGHFSLKIGGTTVSGVTITAPAVQADAPYIFRQMLTCRSVAGSSALLMGQHWVDYIGGVTTTARTAGVTVAVTALGISFTGYWDNITDTPSMTSTNCDITTGF